MGNELDDGVRARSLTAVVCTLRDNAIWTEGAWKPRKQATSEFTTDYFDLIALDQARACLRFLKIGAKEPCVAPRAMADATDHPLVRHGIPLESVENLLLMFSTGVFDAVASSLFRADQPVLAYTSTTMPLSSALLMVV